MGKVIVNQFVTLDGIVEDPDGSGGAPGGGWAFRGAVAHVVADDFGLGPILETGAFLLGRRTWEMFATRWPSRSGDFATAMNRAAKVVVTSSTPDLDAWSNSSRLDGELLDGVAALARRRDVVVIGSTSVVHALAAADAVDEYRLLVVPVALGAGRPLFERPVDLRVTSVDTVGAAVLTRLERPSECAARGRPS